MSLAFTMSLFVNATLNFKVVSIHYDSSLKDCKDPSQGYHSQKIWDGFKRSIKPTSYKPVVKAELGKSVIKVLNEILWYVPCSKCRVFSDGPPVLPWASWGFFSSVLFLNPCRRWYYGLPALQHPDFQKRPYIQIWWMFLHGCFSYGQNAHLHFKNISISKRLSEISFQMYYGQSDIFLQHHLPWIYENSVEILGSKQYLLDRYLRNGLSI